MGIFMNNRNRKFARPPKPKTSCITNENTDAEFTLSASAAIGILGGTFLMGLAAGRLLDICKKYR